MNDLITRTMTWDLEMTTTHGETLELLAGQVVEWDSEGNLNGLTDLHVDGVTVCGVTERQLETITDHAS